MEKILEKLREIERELHEARNKAKSSYAIKEISRALDHLASARTILRVLTAIEK